MLISSQFIINIIIFKKTNLNYTKLYIHKLEKLNLININTIIIT